MLKREFYLRDANTAAKDLLGKLLVCKSPLGTSSGMIVETEAYGGALDPASHSYKNRRTPRTEIEYHEGGVAYVYFIYGMYYCFNVVVNARDIPDAVLVRALEPVDGIELMTKRRNTDNLLNLCSGPGKLCAALGIGNNHYGSDLRGDELFITEFKSVPENNIAAAPRINVDYAGEAKDYLWRYYIRNNKYVSRISANR
jgi:DNA-3-methyladenine glycosylase